MKQESRPSQKCKINAGNFGNVNSFHSFAPRILQMEVKDRIQEKALEMFMRYGIRSVSMDEIAGQLGMSKKTLYQHFVDKDELIEAVVADDVNKGEQDCLNSCQMAGNAIEEVFILMQSVLKQIREMNPVVIYDLQKFHPKAFRHFEKHKNEFILSMVKQNMQRGIKEELYREDISIDILSRYRLESMFIPFNMDVFPPSKYEVATVAREVMVHFTFGIATSKGHKLIQKYLKEFSI